MTLLRAALNSWWRYTPPASMQPTWSSELGFYPAPPGSPKDIPGMELAGEVVAIGSQVTRFAPGDRVMGVVGGGRPGHAGRH